ncbi:MAG: hypothetical protein OEM22_06700 [Acidimicrobiia bacterium]|nr:hypothetical protein [Acidimicrobiia bacterium]
MSYKPFRFSLGIGGANNVEDLTVTLKRAEAAGFDVVSGADHIGPYLAVLPKLAAAARDPCSGGGPFSRPLATFVNPGTPGRDLA